MKVRRPAVSGMFYAGTPEELEEQIGWCYKHELGPGSIPRVNSKGLRKIVAIVVPHAGYYYSGPVAAHAYKELADDGVFDTAVILGPNHTGYGHPVSLWAGGSWSTPLGEVEVDKKLAQRLLGDVIRADETAHMHEHSIEVQLPWLQYLYGKVRIVPITMLAQDIETARIVGKSVGQAGENLIVIASSDLTHYEPHSVAMEKDSSVIEAIIALDEEGLYERCERLGCTMCGYGPVAAAIVASKEMKGKKASLLKYATSGDTGGDFSRVVGYGSIVIKR
ncbi:MAG: AmmeMemoRadiSam system protein B [Dehalococcoidia bacterium]|nr:AmmeMemoRadiSam system protein B [Dehalococcoidia bacterium]MDH4299492.1 AmmeMemoRadiSam system protein B [Dehalococcoidia bacterium]MDH4367972.1 AmmeMemoRadiSam system protein B [Dehalococcoidia bacterium]